MPPFYRIIETAVYALLNFLPLALVLLYMFRHVLRFSFKVVGAVLALLCLIQIGIGMLSAFHPGIYSSILSLLSTLIYIGFFLFVVRAPVGESLFVLLMLSNIANYIVTLSKCLEGILRPQLALQQYRWSFSFCMAVVMLALSGPLYLYLKQVIAPVIHMHYEDRDWYFLWLLPAVFYFIWYNCLYVISDRSPLMQALRPRTTLVLTFINLGALLVYFVVARLLTTSEHKRVLEHQHSILALQELQYEKLKSSIRETRHLRHDLRHHLTVLSGFIKTEDYQSAARYLEEYSASVPDLSGLKLCDNLAVNVLLLHFSGKARQDDIEFHVSASLSESIPVPDSDLSVLFGNLLENALFACRKDTAPVKKIVVRIDETPMALYFTIDNTWHGEMIKDENGEYVSSRHDGCGIGIRSCRNIVGRYQGTLQIRQDEDMLYVSVMLNFPQDGDE